MKELILVSSLISLFLFHPLEKSNYEINVENYTNFEGTIKNEYIMPADGIVKEIVFENNRFSVKILTQEYGEFVYSGLEAVYVTEGIELKKRTKVGIDHSINDNTILISLFYRDVVDYPQIYQDKVNFFVDKGTKVFSIGEGSVTYLGYDKKDGMIMVQKIANSSLDIVYTNLGAYTVKVEENTNIGDLVAYSNSTGEVLIPQLGLKFFDDKASSFKIIYIKYENDSAN